MRSRPSHPSLDLTGIGPHQIAQGKRTQDINVITTVLFIRHRVAGAHCRAARLPDGQITDDFDFAVESMAQKYFASRAPQIKFITSPSHPLTRGVSRSSRTLGWDAVDARMSCVRT
jgi:hypothetical protein